MGATPLLDKEIKRFDRLCQEEKILSGKLSSCSDPHRAIIYRRLLARIETNIRDTARGQFPLELFS